MATEEAEIERLQVALAVRGTEHRRDMEYCNTEIERLRAALHKIAEHPDTPELIRQYAVSQQQRENEQK